MLADIFYQDKITPVVRWPDDASNTRTVRFYLLLTTFVEAPAKLVAKFR